MLLVQKLVAAFNYPSMLGRFLGRSLTLGWESQRFQNWTQAALIGARFGVCVGEDDL